MPDCRGHKTEDYLIFKRGLSYIEKRIILYREEDNPLWRGCFSMNLSAIPYWMLRVSQNDFEHRDAETQRFYWFTNIFSLCLCASVFYFPIMIHPPHRGFSSLKKRVVVRMVILVFLEWSFPSARNGHSNDFRLAILMGIRLVILIRLEWPFPRVGSGESQQERL